MRQEPVVFRFGEGSSKYRAILPGRATPPNVLESVPVVALAGRRSDGVGHAQQAMRCALTTAPMRTALHCIVTGLVQGVFYRASARAEARRLGVTGWVRNRADGSVEVFACGEPEAVDRLRRWLRRGPAGARVDRVEVTEAPPEEAESFEIRP